jgi:Rod binding domain-containing protein
MLPIGTSTADAGGAIQSGSLQTPQPRLVRAAHEFEAQMMKELLKPMTSGDGLTGEEEDSGSGTGGALGEFASEALGRALSERGGLGIANAIVGDLSHSGNKSEGGKVTGKLHGDAVMKTFE